MNSETMKQMNNTKEMNQWREIEKKIKKIIQSEKYKRCKMGLID